MSFVVAAKELVFRFGQARACGGLSDHQQQMTILRLKVEDLHVGVLGRLDVKVFSSAVGADVDHDRTLSLSPAVRDQRANFGSDAELREFGLDALSVHNWKDTLDRSLVRFEKGVSDGLLQGLAEINWVASRDIEDNK
jgi:hypothetical protein